MQPPRAQGLCGSELRKLGEPFGKELQKIDLQLTHRKVGSLQDRIEIIFRNLSGNSNFRNDEELFIFLSVRRPSSM